MPANSAAIKRRNETFAKNIEKRGSSSASNAKKKETEVNPLMQSFSGKLIVYGLLIIVIGSSLIEVIRMFM